MSVNQLGRWVWRLFYACVCGWLMSTVLGSNALGRDRSFSASAKGRRKGYAIIISQMRTLKQLVPKEDLPQRDQGTFLRSYLALQSFRSLALSCKKRRGKKCSKSAQTTKQGKGWRGMGGCENTEHKQACGKIWKGIKN